MRIPHWFSTLLLLSALSITLAGTQGLDRNAQRMVNDAARDLKSRDAMDDPSPEVAVLAAGALRLLGASKADVQKANERGLASSRDGRIRFLAARALMALHQPHR